MAATQENFQVLAMSGDLALAELLTSTLRAAGYAVATALVEGREPDVAIVDLDSHEESPAELLERLKKGAPDCQIIAVAEEPQRLREAVAEGAFWYLTKPFAREVLLHYVAKACVIHELTHNHRLLFAALCEPLAPDLFAESPVMKGIVKKVAKIAPLDSTVLITGESGTGKTMLARYIHKHSSCAAGPFVTVSCAAIPRELLEAELFGYERGAFTGALHTRPGTAELADGGTLFLDEVGELPIDLQPKLLTFLQDRTLKRLGATRTTPVRTRVIAATNQDLRALIRQRLFREDLFFRLNVLEVVLPPLREREKDLAGLVKSILERIARQRHSGAYRLSPGALKKLQAHSWPGNIRELENVLERATAFCDGAEIVSENIDTEPGTPAETAFVPGRTLDERIAAIINDCVVSHNGDKAKAAAELGISLKTIYNRTGSKAK